MASAGFGMLAWMVAEVGIDSLRAALRPAGIGGLAAVVSVFAVAQIPSCLAWRLLMPGAVSFGPLYRAYVIGDAFNLTVPSADTAGELAKIVMLKNRLPWESLAASLTLHRVLELIASCALLAAGLLVSWLRLALPLWWHATGAAMLLATLGLVAGFFLAQRTAGVYGPLLRNLVPRFGASSGVGATIDRELRERLSRRSEFVWAAVLVIGSWAAGVGEVYLSLWVLGLPARWDVALTVDAFSVVASNLAFFVPGRLGVSDGGRVLLLSALGVQLPGAVAFAVLRRAREVAWAGLGFALLLSHREDGPRVRVAVGGIAGDGSDEATGR